MVKLSHSKFSRFIIILALLLICVISYGVGVKSATIYNHTSASDSQQLELTIVNDAGNIHSYSPEDLGNNFDGDLIYSQVKDVRITIGKESYLLQEAITNGIITVEEIIAAARIDERNHFCREVSETKNGLTKFVYQYYDQFDLGVYYDIYETPDGNEHLISHVRIYEYAAGTREGFQFTKTDENGNIIAIDREDWGLKFEPIEATPTYVDFKITQSGGQQFGELAYWVLSFFDMNENTMLENPHPSSTGSVVIPSEEVSIHRIDWSETLGELAPGQYYLQLRIEDVFDPALLHPFTTDFYDQQSYYFIFEIP